MSKMRASLLIGILLVPACTAGSSGDSSNAAGAVSTSYFNVEKCWRHSASADNFRGALALYESPSGAQSVLFSSRCTPGHDLDSLGTSFRVRALCVSRAGSAPECQKRDHVELNTQLFDPGIRPEFPTSIHAIEGTLSEKYERADDLLIFDHLVIEYSQALPREMFGAFVLNIEERRHYVDAYLGSQSLSDEGYRQLK